MMDKLDERMVECYELVIDDVEPCFFFKARLRYYDKCFEVHLPYKITYTPEVFKKWTGRGAIDAIATEGVDGKKVTGLALSDMDNGLRISVDREQCIVESPKDGTYQVTEGRYDWKISEIEKQRYIDSWKRGDYCYWKCL